MKKENRLFPPVPNCLCSVFCRAADFLFFLKINRDFRLSICMQQQGDLQAPLPLTRPFLMAYICKANCSNSTSLLRAIATCHMQLASCASEMQKSLSINNFQHLQRVAPACRKPIGWCNAREGEGAACTGSEACHLHAVNGACQCDV